MLKRERIKTPGKESERSRGEGLNIPHFAAICCLISVFIIGAAPPPVSGTRIVSADHPLAAKAGAKIFFQGGNSVDAAVATALAAGVVQPAGSGLGGGGFAVVYDSSEGKSGFSRVFDFREVAPSAAQETMYQDENGGVIAGASRNGGRAVAVPAEGSGLAALMREGGRLGMKKVAAPAIRLADKGFPMGAHLAAALSKPTSAGVLALFERDGRPIGRYQTVRNPALARTIRRWASSDGASIQSGKDALHIVETVRADDGYLRPEDLARYQPAVRTPILAKYKGYTLITMPPPSSGGVVFAQVLRALEGVKFGNISHNSSKYFHLLAEAMKHSYADRAHHLGDPDFVEVPLERLLSEGRVQEIRSAFDPQKTFPTEFYGQRIAPPLDGGTQHISTQDGEMGVALTTTINTRFGSGLVVPELGIILNNEMDDFSAAPGVQNAYGLIGSKANAIAPGKRPLSSMTPTVVLDPDGSLYMVLGASGGSTIISACIQVFLNIVEFGMDPQEAVSAPRMHHQWIPEELFLEPEIPWDVVEKLQEKGHRIVQKTAFSSVQVTVRGPKGLEAGADPRKGGWPASVESLKD